MHARDWSTFLLPAAVLAAPAYGADYLSVAQAQALLFPAAKSFTERPLVLDEAQREQVRAASGLRQRWPEQKVWRAEQDGSGLDVSRTRLQAKRAETGRRGVAEVAHGIISIDFKIIDNF